MRKFYKAFTLLALITTVAITSIAQNNFFSDAGANRTMATNGQRALFPNTFRTSSLDVQRIRQFLWSLPAENGLSNRLSAPIISLPMPDGNTARFRVWESSIQEPELAAKFSEIKTFAGQGIDDPAATIRFDFNPYFGFSAQILSPNGRIFIDPFARYDVNTYMSYYARDYPGNHGFNCTADDLPENTRASIQQRVAAGPCLGTQLRTFRLAFTCTGEFAQAVGGGLAGPTHAAIITGVNRLTQVYEDELAIRLVLIANNDLIEFLNPATDPWNNDGSIAELNSITANINTALASVGGASAYDIGHLGCTASNAGVAGLGVVCGASKGRGLTGGLNPVGDPYYIDYVAHEMGHQFNAAHTFNSNQCASSGGSYEPGSGTTIMAYAGICASTENIQPNSDPIFHAFSFDQIGNFVTTGPGSCAAITSTGNTLPVINSMTASNLSIPINTPFTLDASATDANGDAITYNWEGWDVGAAGSWPSAASSTTRPLFRTRVSKTTGSRTFPDIRVIAANYPGTGAPSAMDGLRGEVLPLVARTMKFRLTVRDNRAGGGGVVSSGEGCQGATVFQVNVVGTTPFAVTAPNGGESWAGGTSQTITWNVAGTDQAPFNVANVRISLSTDGGLTYPTVLAASTPNDGSESLNIPGPASTTARVKVEAIGNIFFDISNANFTITAPVSSFSFNSPAPVTTACPAGATMQVSLGTISNGGFSNPITLSATAGVPAGTNVTFSTNPVTPGNSSAVTLNNTNTLAAGTYVITITGVATGAPNQTRDLTFTITGSAGPAITTQPSNAAICVTGNTSFSIAAATATTFQWQISTDGGATYSNVTNAGVYSGATTNTLTITGATIGLNNNRYRCIASTQCGSSTSNAGILTVNAAPAVTGQPQDITLCAGSNHTFSVTATGGGLGYQWQLSTDGGGTYNNITNGGIYSGATTSSLTLTGLTAGLSGNRYRCVVTGSCPPAVNSNGAILTVVTSVTVTTQPTDATVCEGSNSSFTVAGSGAGIIYQWQVSTDGGTTYTNVANGGVYSGATAATLNITGTMFSLNTYRYRCQLSNATCTTPGVSNAGILTVNTLPAVTSNPANSTICLGGATSFSAAATGTGIGYQWQVSTDGGTTYTNITDGGVYAGATTTTLTITGATAAMNNYRYRVAVSGTCAPAANSTGAILTVINPVAITAQPVNSEICSGSNTSFSVTGSSTQTIIYRWEISTNGGTSFNPVTNTGIYSGATTATLTITNASTAVTGYQYRCVVSNATCFGANETTSGAATLTVRQLPTVALAAAPLTALLPGQSTTLTATPSASTGGVLTTSWFFNNNGVANTGNTRTVNVEQVGDYQVRIQETWPSVPTPLVCSNQSAVVAITAQASERLFIFPSPNNGTFQVAYYNSTGASSSRTITIYNAAGSKVHHEKFAVSGSYTLLDINLPTAAKGLYYVVVGDVSGKRIAKGNVLIQ